MAVKESAIARFNPASIRRRPVRTVQNLVPSLTGDKKEAAMLPLAEGQAPIAQQGRSPNYDAGSIMGLISSLRSPGEVNPAFDPNAPVGGENVPYKGTSGAGGLFSRIFGNRANELNIEAQQTQAAEIRDKAAREEERQFELEKVREADKGPAARAKERLQYEKDKDIRDEIAREDAINLALAREGEKDILSDIDMARKEAAAEQERALKTRELDIREAAVKPPRFSPIGNTGLFQTPEGELGVFEPGTPSFGTMKGTAPRIRMMTGAGSKAPANTSGGSMVDRITGATLGGPLPTTSAAAPKAAAPTRPSLMNMIGAGAENVAGALGLEGLSEVPAALGDLLTPDTQTLEKAARSRARYLNPSMQRTY